MTAQWCEDLLDIALQNESMTSRMAQQLLLLVNPPNLCRAFARCVADLPESTGMTPEVELAAYELDVPACGTANASCHGRPKRDNASKF